MRHAKRLGGFVILIASCTKDGGGPALTGTRFDTAMPVAISGATGSFQNPCWSPDGARLAFTDFHARYNVGPATVSLVSSSGGTPVALTPGAGDEVNMPGGCWDAAHGLIAFTSDQSSTGHDEVFTVPVAGGTLVQITSRSSDQAFEPTFSPDGSWIVFESHPVGDDGHGTLWKVRANGTGAVALTSLAQIPDARQPVWSPIGGKIVFQAPGTGGPFDVFTIATDGSGLVNVTHSPAEDTDASFSPDGTFIVYSSNEGGLPAANVFAIPVVGGTPTRITMSDGYDGAPAWSPDGSKVAFESYGGDPDGSPGTRLLVIAVPAL